MAHPASATRARNMERRSFRRPRLYGEALRLTTTSAPPRPCWATGPSGNHTSSQTEMPTQAPATPKRVGVSVAGDEPALLVEDAVVGQATLAVGPHDPASGADGGRVGEARARRVGAHVADHDGALATGGGHLLQRRDIVGHEGRLEEEVLGRVARVWPARARRRCRLRPLRPRTARPGCGPRCPRDHPRRCRAGLRPRAGRASTQTNGRQFLPVLFGEEVCAGARRTPPAARIRGDGRRPA